MRRMRSCTRALAGWATCSTRSGSQRSTSPPGERSTRTAPHCATSIGRRTWMTRMRRMGVKIRRRPTDAGWLAAGSGIVLLTASAIDGNSATDAEVAVFRLVNDAPDALFYVLWVRMQFGTFVAVPFTAVGAFIARRPRLAIEAAGAGPVAYFMSRR